MTAPQTVTVIITNYNYARFVGEAIESALAQTHPCTEVIVVDDGSVDGSRAVIERYKDRVAIVFKKNGGQGSAFNAGVAASRGEIIMFLDADDLLEPVAAAAVIGALEGCPAASKAQFRLQTIDESGESLGRLMPARHLKMPSGDLRETVARAQAYVFPPQSGNAFRAGALEKILPVPETVYRISADRHLNLASALVGEVVSIDCVLGRYRVHDTNAYDARGLDLVPLRRDVQIIIGGHEALRRVAQISGAPEMPESPLEIRDVAFLAARLVSVKLEPQSHPAPGDRALLLALRGAWLSITERDSPIRRRALRMLWFAGVVASPRPLARALAEAFFVPQSRAWFRWWPGHRVANV